MSDAADVPSFTGGAPMRAVHTLLCAVTSKAIPAPARSASSRSELTSLVSSLALEHGYVVEHVDVFRDELPTLLSRRDPFVFFPVPEGDEIYAVGAGGRRALSFLDARGHLVSVPRDAAERAFSRSSAARAESVAAKIAAAGVGVAGGDAKIARALAAELDVGAPMGWAYVFRPNLAESMPRMFGSLRLGSYAAQLLALSGLQSVLTTIAWAIIGTIAIAGHAATGNLLGWALVSITATFVQVASTRVVGRFTIRAATTLRQRLLEGALGLDPERLGTFGLGGLMVIATQADSFLGSVIALFLALLGVLTNLVAATVVLSISPMPGLTLAMFFCCVVGVLCALPRVASRQSAQQQERMALTTDMVERMLGHGTRLVQQTPNSWHDGEDESVRAYAENSRTLDRLVTRLRAVPRAYYVASMVAVFIILVAHPTQVALALSIGGMTLGMAALDALVGVVTAGGGLYALWTAIQPVVRDGDDGASAVPSPAVEDVDMDSAGGALLELRGVRFGYPNRTKPVLDDATLRIEAGERVLIEGASGGGKTTLASLLSGLRRPEAGLLLVRGIDQHTLGEAELRRVVASAPQFYKNHVFSASLLFNLLLGRCWPASAEDVREAQTVAVALGLGPLLTRMPAGIWQQVGETGWQLSHGEKSRVYLARALLQRADLLVLDETFGALDPASLQQSMDVVLELAKTLVVITHR